MRQPHKCRLPDLALEVMIRKGIDHFLVHPFFQKLHMIKRTAVNPWPWSVRYSFNQAELIENQSRVLFCSGQASVDQDGKPKFSGDMRGQVQLAFENLDSVLKAGNMNFSNVVKLVLYTTDIDALVSNFGVVVNRMKAANNAPAQTMIQVGRLFLPELLFEVEAIAVV